MASRIGSVLQLKRDMSEDKKNTRGGARPGAGRKPLTVEEREAARKTLDSCRKMIRLEPGEVAAAQLRAKRAGVTLHAWLVAAVRKALHSTE